MIRARKLRITLRFNFNNLSMPKSAKSLGSIRQHSNKLVVLARLLDVLVIGITLWSVLIWGAIEWDNKHTWWLLISVVGFGVFASFNELYRESRVMSAITEAKLIVISWFSVLLVLIFVDEVVPLIDPIYKENFLKWSLFVPVEIISWHVIWRNLAVLFRKLGNNRHRAAIVGATLIGAELEKRLQGDDSLGIQFVGFYDDRQRISENEEPFDLSKLKGDIDQLTDIAMTVSGISRITEGARFQRRAKPAVEQIVGIGQ